MTSSKAAEFWAWFAANAKRFSPIPETRDEAVIEEILERLQRYDELYFEMGGRPEGPIELVITAGGDAGKFDAVRMLVAAAPAIDGWVAVAFKQPHGFGFAIEYDGAHIDPKACSFRAAPVDGESRMDLEIGCPTYDPAMHESFAAGVFIVIDTAIGEHASATEIGCIEIGPPLDGPDARPLVELGDLLALRRGRE